MTPLTETLADSQNTGSLKSKVRGGTGTRSTVLAVRRSRPSNAEVRTRRLMVELCADDQNLVRHPRWRMDTDAKQLKAAAAHACARELFAETKCGVTVLNVLHAGLSDKLLARWAKAYLARVA